MNKNVMIAMEKIEQLDGQFNHYSINRYLQTKLRDIDFSVTTIKEWFQKEQLILAENSVLFSFSEYETFIEFLVEYASKNYKKNLNDTESVFTDYQYIEFLLYLITHSELEKMERKISEVLSDFNISIEKINQKICLAENKIKKSYSLLE